MPNVYKDKKFLIVQNAFLDFQSGDLLSPVETEHYTILQVAESYFIGSLESHAHRQLCDLEITLSLTGTVVSSADGREERVEKNSAYISFRGEEHQLYSKSSCRFLTLAINFKDAARPLFSAIAERFSRERTVADADPSGILSRIAAEFSGERRLFFESFLDALIGELLISLVRPEPTFSSDESAEGRMAEIINYIDCNYLSICSPEELSRFGYSYHYICARFKEIYGCSPGAYLLSKRMDHAARLLSAGQSVSAVSSVLGYSSPYNFSRAYKKHFGYPPKYTTLRVDDMHGESRDDIPSRGDG